MYYTYEEHLDRARVALNNTESQPDLAEALAGYGFDHDRIQEGKSLLSKAEAAQRTYVREQGEQLAATGDLESARLACRRAYDKDAKLARLAFRKSPDALVRLGLAGRRKQNYSGWTEQVKQFYDAALNTPSILEGFGRYNYGRDRLHVGADLLHAVLDANDAQENEKGETQLASQSRIAAFEALDDYMDEFEGLVDVVFHDDPQQAERLGTHVPNG